MDNTMTKTTKVNILPMLIGSITAVSISLVLILVFAVVLRFVDLDNGWIMPINQAIKIISILFGVKVTLKNNKTKGFLRGMCTGIIYTITAYLIFSLLSLSFNFNISFLLDLLCSAIVGGISGIFFVNI